MNLNDNSYIGAVVSAIPWTYLASGAAATISLIVLFKKLVESPKHKNGISLPPGPPATWFWKSPMPKKHIAHQLAALVEQYGPVISLRSGRDVTIIIGRMDEAFEIMEKEGGALADRPRWVAAGEILSGGMRVIFQHAGERLRRLRRTAHTHLQLKAVQTYEGIQADAAKDVILDILNNPKQLIQHAHRFAAATIMRITYGKSTPMSCDDPDLVRVREVAKNFRETSTPGAYIVDRIPWLKHVPIFTRRLRELHQYELALFRDQLNRVRNDMSADSAGPSFTKMLLEDMNDHKLSEDEMAYLAGAFFGAAVDSTASGIIVMTMAAACHPDAQARVQEELDEVIGRDRPPTFSDWDMLPQLQAFLLEAMRWRPLSPIGFSHRAMKDIIWKGYCIPEGATVFGCHWVISRDPIAFPDPETFNPQRWLTEDGRLRSDMHFYTFGFGRRVCPGRHLADRSLFINLALLLWSFRISQRPEDPVQLGLNGFEHVFTFQPQQLEVDFVPRIERQKLWELMAH